MPQVINTNVSALNAQRNLDQSGSDLAVSLQRLSSGLRINSAKDDAAGLAIATRFTSRIQGLGQAQRNANDAISLSQVAEGALGETTTILQRARELAIQSANGSNSAADRRALQSEVNELKQELTRIAENTTFNGLNVLNGDLSNTSFQIGSEANQTVSVSIADTRTTAIGTNQVETNNAAGIEQATYQGYIGGGTSSDSTGVGTDIGIISQGADTNSSYAATTFTVTNTTTTGGTTQQTLTSSANESAADTAASLSTLTGVTATAYNEVSLSSISTSDTDDILTLHVSGNGTDVSAEIISSDTDSYSEIATLINANTDFQGAGVYAVASATDVTIFATGGETLAFSGESTGAGEVQVTVTSAFNSDAAGTAALSFDSDSEITGGANTSAAVAGRVDVQLNAEYTIAADDVGILGGTTGTAVTTSAAGLSGISGGNNVEAQTVTISGSTGTTTVSVVADEEASAIATKINAVSGTTNVTASASTELTLQNLSADGTVTFNLYGENVSSAPAAISAAVTTSDFTALVDAINDQTGATGISAATDGANNVIVLSNTTGKNISIEDFTHSAGIDYQAPTTDSPVTSDGSSVSSPVTASLDVVGNADTNKDATGTYAGTTVTLFDGGDKTNFDSAVVGGQVTLSSAATFSASSSISGTSLTNGNPDVAGSLFGVGASAGNSSSATTVNNIDISTASGAQSAIDVLDQAINQVSEIRADLGAVQSRFESAIRNISNNIENLSVARSRILDTDFASETAALTKNQILQQAGTSILAQANQLPQNVLSLLG